MSGTHYRRNHMPDDFLRVGGDGGNGRVGSTCSCSHPPCVLHCVRKLRSGRLAWLGRIITALAGLVPEGLFRWALDGLDGGSIWDDEVARDGGPSDTGVIRIARRENEQVGMKIVAALTPIVVVVGLMAVGFMLLLSERRIMREASRTRPATIMPATPPIEHGGAILVHHRHRFTRGSSIGPRWSQ